MKYEQKYINLFSQTNMKNAVGGTQVLDDNEHWFACTVMYMYINCSIYITSE